MITKREPLEPEMSAVREFDVCTYCGAEVPVGLVTLHASGCQWTLTKTRAVTAAARSKAGDK